MSIGRRHARLIRAGIHRARYVQELLDGINLDPKSTAAFYLAQAVSREARAETPELEHRAYLRTRVALMRKPIRNSSTGRES